MKVTKAIPAPAMHVTLMLDCAAATKAIPTIAVEERVPITIESVSILKESFM